MPPDPVRTAHVHPFQHSPDKPFRGTRPASDHGTFPPEIVTSCHVHCIQFFGGFQPKPGDLCIIGFFVVSKQFFGSSCLFPRAHLRAVFRFFWGERKGFCQGQREVFRHGNTNGTPLHVQFTLFITGFKWLDAFAGIAVLSCQLPTALL